MGKMKTCFKCGETKSQGEFYRHKEMADGRLGKCKDCTRKDAREHRDANLERIRAKDRARGNRSTPAYQRSYRERYPAKAKARRKVAYEVSKGRLHSKPCEVCGCGKANAHHDDYSKPMEVRWLCQEHHVEWHRENGPGLNG